MSAVRREFHEQNGGKFWVVTIDGMSRTVEFGKVGSNSRSRSSKSFSSVAGCEKDVAKLIAGKLKKGYVEVGVDDAGSRSAPVKPLKSPKGSKPSVTTKSVTTKPTISGYGRYGDHRSARENEARALVSDLIAELTTEEFCHVDYEHSRITVCHEPTGWSIEVAVSGRLRLSRGDDGEESSLVGLSVEELGTLLTALALGRIDEVEAHAWRDEVQMPVEDLYVLASHERVPSLHKAAASGRLDWLAHELSRRKDVDEPGPFGETALHWAARAGHAKACKKLIDAGADLDAPGEEGETVEQSAELCEFGPDAVLKILRGARRAAGGSRRPARSTSKRGRGAS